MANNNNTKNLNVPNLRFPEFDGEWKKKMLGDLCSKFNSGKNIKSDEILDDGTFPVFGGNGLRGFTHKYNYDGEYAIVGRQGALCGNVRLIKGKCYMTEHAIVIQGNDDNSTKFLLHLLNKLNLSQYSDQSAQPGLAVNKLQKIKVIIPNLSEQNKIATFLSLLDQRIEIQNKIIEKYESLIKGISNKLFSQDIRFKANNGNVFPNWKTNSFKHIGQTFSGLSGKAKEDFGLGKPYIQYKQVFDSPIIQIQNCGLVHVSNSEKQNNVKYGDILFTISSETPDEIGMSSVLLDEVDEMYLNSFCFGYRLSSFEVLSPLYASYLFRDSSFRNKIVKIAQGSTRYNISKSELLKLKISLPCIEEQLLIASFLLTVDDKIKIEKEILKLYLQQKNYLLRQMFI